MFLLLFWCVFVTKLNHGASENSFDFPAVRGTWIKSALLEKFATTRHHITGIGNKTKAKDFIVEHFENLQLTVQYDEFVTAKLKEPGVNIIGILPGFQGNDSLDTVDTVYIVGAYYDTKKMTEGLFNNGAGVVAMLESARLLVHSGAKKNTLLFVAFDLHATDDFNKESCCQGARHFVDVWLPDYIESRKKVDFGGIIILESILNFDNTTNSQISNTRNSVAALMFKDLFTLVAKDQNRGNFMLVICREKDADLKEPFTQIWNFFPEMKSKIHSLQFSLAFSNDLIFKIIEENILDTDLLAFYMKNKKGILISDTERYRGKMIKCHKTRCDETTFLTNKRLQFVAKTVGTVVFTLELLGNGDLSDTIIAHMEHLRNIQTTMATVSKPPEQKCPKADYSYDEKANVHYKIYKDFIHRVPWSDAKTVCEDDGAQLLIIRTKKMLDFAIRKIKMVMWVGMSDMGNEGEWKWVDGTNVTKGLWDTCQPDDFYLGEDCGMWHDINHKLIDMDCSFIYMPFICTCIDNSTLSAEGALQEEDDFQEEVCFVEGYSMIEDDILYYKVYDVFLNHIEANDTCISDGTSLLSISTLYEYSFMNKLRSELADKLYHIASDVQFYQLFLKTDLNETSTRIFNNDGSHCFVLDGSTLSLDYRNCSDNLMFICGIYCPEKDINKQYPDKADYEQGHLDRHEILASTDKSIKHFIIENQVRLSFIKEIRTEEPVYTMDILYQRNLLFWHSRETTFIMETAMDNFTNHIHRRFVYTGDPYTYIAVDWLYENVYWSSMVLQTISVSNGNYTKILYARDIHKPTYVQLDSFTGVLFWLDPLGVMLATMDGQDKVRVVSGKFDQIAVDGFLKTLFISHGSSIRRQWFHPSEDIIQQMFYESDFSTSACLNKQRFSQNIDVTVRGGSLPITKYMNDINTKNIYPLSFADIIFIDNSSFIGIKNMYKMGKPNVLYPQHVFHLNEQWINVKFKDERKVNCIDQECTYVNDSCSMLKLPKFKNTFSCVCPLDGVFLAAINGSCDISICSNENGKCSQQCNEMDYYPYVYCTCYKGFQLLLDGKTCIREDVAQALILFSGKTDLTLYLPQGKFEYRKQINIKDFETYDTAGITFDPLEFKIYWVQDKVFGIKRAYINGTGKEECYTGSSKELRSLTLDVFKRRLMFSAPGNFSIESVNTDGKDHQVDHRLPNVFYACSFILDTFNGFIYYHRQNRFKPSDNGIYRFDIETKEVETIIHLEGQIPLRSFDVCHIDGLIFFISGEFNGQIKKRQIRGTKEKIIIPKTQMIQYTHVYLQENNLYTVGTIGEFARYNIKEEEGELLSSIHGFHSIVSITGGYYQPIRNIEEKDVKTCTEISKCLDSSMVWICLTPDQICDGIDHCHDNHDEMHCEYKEHQNKYTYVHLSCPKHFPPQEYVYDEQDLFFVNWDTHLFSRFINFTDFLLIRCSVEYEITNSIDSSQQMFKLTLFNIYNRFRQIIKSNVLRGRHQYIRKLVLSGQGISQKWSDKTFKELTGLKTLELSEVQLEILRNGIFIHLSQLTTIQMHLKSLVEIESEAFIGIHKCETLTISGTKITRLHPDTFNNLKNLISLDIAYNKLTVLDGLFKNLVSLQSIDTRGNDIYIVERLFDTNINLQLIYSDTFAVCCVKPKHMSADGCIAPQFDVSSCETLIENNVLRIFLWIIGLLAVVGNVCVLFYRISNEGGLFVDTFSVLVGNLSVADTLIGVYLISIGIADQEFRGEYIRREYKWRNSGLCSGLGILSVLSSEVSVLTISLVTVARYFVVKFPFREYKISRKNAVAGCVMIWVFSLLMGLFPYFAFENYYSSSGVCVSLPIRKEATAGWIYSFSLFVVFNFLTFLFIALAQGPIVFEVKKISSGVQRTGDLKHIVVAKRLSLVVATDCLCWLPIGTMGLMAMFGYDMPRTIYAWTVVLVLPINSAVNPFLYTFIDTKMLPIMMKSMVTVVKAIPKGISKSIWYISIGISATLMIGIILSIIKDFDDTFKRHRQLYDAYSKKQQDVERLKFQTASIRWKVKNFQEEAQNEYCHKPLTENGTGYCCVDWIDVNKQCFQINTNGTKWYDAEIKCRQYGNLVNLQNVKISDFVKSILHESGKNLSFWVGLYKHLDKKYEHRWIDTNARFEYSTLRLRSGAQCVNLEIIGEYYPFEVIGDPGTYRLYDRSCAIKKGFICQIDEGIQRTYVPASACPYGWHNIGMSCFFFQPFLTTFLGAEYYCERHDGAYLARIDSADVDDKLQPLLWDYNEGYGGGVFWIGMKYWNGEWRWLKTEEPANYNNWAEGEPQNRNSCVTYKLSNDNYKWHASESDHCLYGRSYHLSICQKAPYNYY